MIKWESYEPVGLTMYMHQRRTAEFIFRYKRGFILNDIGTGKTVSALSAYDFLMMHNKVKRVLITSPLSVVRATWVDHLIKFYPGRDFTVLHGTREQRIANLNLDVNFYIINTDGIKVIEKEILKRGFDALIIDESTNFSSHSSQRTKCAWRISQKIPSVICMTGNPIPNDTLQSYAQAKLIHFDKPRYFTKFRDQLKIKQDMYTYYDRDEAVDIAYSVLQPAIRFKMEDCLDLPPITHQVREIKMTAEQKSHFDMMEKEYITFLKEGKSASAANAGVRQLKLLQISCGIIIDDNGEAEDLDQKYRLQELKDIVNQTRKIIVFAVFTKSINNLLNHFPKAEKIDGKVPSHLRHDRIKRFQEGDLDMLICQPAAISHGVTLTASNTIVWWSPPYSNEHFQQCNGRIRRPGQKRPQLIIKFQSSKTERKVFAALERKQKVSQALLDYAVED